MKLKNQYSGASIVFERKNSSLFNNYRVLTFEYGSVDFSNAIVLRLSPGLCIPR